MTRKPLSFLLLAIMLSGCTMIPEFSRPDFSAAQNWNDLPGYELQTGADMAAQMDWKEFFNSQEFHLVIGTALQNNKDLKTAALNIEEARALYRIERADLFPSVKPMETERLPKARMKAARQAGRKKQSCMRPIWALPHMNWISSAKSAAIMNRPSMNIWQQGKRTQWFAML